MSQTLYATVAQLVSRHDTRVLGELSSDTGVPATVNDGNQNIVAALKQASADIEAAILRGRRYTLDDLAALQTDEDWTLIGMTCDLAVGHMYNRRGSPVSQAVQDRVNDAREKLKSLSDGLQIFRMSSAAEAGIARLVQLDPRERARLHAASDQEIFPRRPIA